MYIYNNKQQLYQVSINKDFHTQWLYTKFIIKSFSVGDDFIMLLSDKYDVYVQGNNHLG